MTIVLLGPQRLTPTVVGVLGSMNIEGQIATVTAGWQEREAEDEELNEAFGRRTVNLSLYRRAEAVLAKDPELRAAYRARSDRLRAMQDIYRFRLEHSLEAAQKLLRWKAEPSIVEPQRHEAVEAVRHLDADHVARCHAVHQEFEHKWRPGQRDAVAAERREIAALIASAGAVALAGGHVAILLNRLRLFGIADAIKKKVVLAWSAGAMCVCEKVVLFHDHPPQGPGAAEVLDAGLGIVRGLVVFPHWRRRLDTTDGERLGLMARRLAPAASLALDDGARLRLEPRGWVDPAGVHWLRLDGTVRPLVTGDAPEGAPS